MPRQRASGPLGLLALLVLWVCLVSSLPSRRASAHEEVVGIVQARFLEPDGLQVLLKLKASELVLAGGLGQGPGVDPAVLLSPDGKHAVWDLLLRKHRIESWRGVCERLSIDRYELSPTGQWLDVVATYRCAEPVEYILVRVDDLLPGPGHSLLGHFDLGGDQVSSFRFTAQDRAFFLFPGDAPAPAPAPAPKVPPSLGQELVRRLLHAEFFLLPLILLSAPMEDRAMWRRALIYGLGGALVMATLPVWLGLVGRIPDLVGLASLLGLGALTVRHSLMQRELRREDLPMLGLIGICAGLSVARDGGLALWQSQLLGVPLLAGLAALAGLGGHWLATRERLRRGAALFVLSFLFFVLTGELYRLAIV